MSTFFFANRQKITNFDYVEGTFVRKINKKGIFLVYVLTYSYLCSRFCESMRLAKLENLKVKLDFINIMSNFIN